MEQAQIKQSPSASGSLPSSQAGSSSEENDEGIALGELVAVVLDHKGLVAIITLMALLIGLAVVWVSRPVFRADGLLQVEERNKGISPLMQLEPLLGESTTVAAELEILNSRMVLGRVVEKRKLNIVAIPKTLPLIGNAIAARYVGEQPNGAVLGLSTYAWGGEVIQVDALDVPLQYLDRPLTLFAGEGDTFSVVDEDGVLVLSGKVGTRASEAGFSIFVAQVKARPGTRFHLMKRSDESAIAELRKRYTVKERGKKSGIIEASLVGNDAAQIALVLDEVLNTYVRQNVERRSAEAEKTLKFLDGQLPTLKAQVDAAEAAYNHYRQSRGSLDLSLETQGVLKSVVDVEDAAVKLKQERDELRQRFTPEHPAIQAVDAKLARLDERRKQFDGEVAKLPDTQQTLLRLARDMEVSTKLYTDLLNTAQQLKVSKEGTLGDVRIIDVAAVGLEPVGLKTTVVLAIASLLGLLVSMLLIFLLRSLRVVVEDPETVESSLGLPVYATIPRSKQELALSRKPRAEKSVGELLAVNYPDDDVVESLRSLRTTLHFALFDTQRNSVLITSSSPGTGKSFISKNLGVVLAQTEKRVVIVDADLRRGHLNKEFNLRREVGVSEYIAGHSPLADIIKSTNVPNLSVITTGQIPPNPSELLMHTRFETLLSELGAAFDAVLIDAPPVLAVSDAIIIGKYVGATLMIARAGKHPIKELEQAVKRLNQGGVTVKGFVFNDFDTARQRYRYGHKGYVYQYSYTK